MEKQEKVLDASIIFKWFSDEKESAQALKLMNEHVNGKIEIVIPEFAIIEVLNGLRYKKKTDEVLKVNQDLWALQLRMVEIDKILLDRAVDIAFNNKLTLYDSIYVALSQILSLPLITTDKELFKIPNVVPLSKI